MRGRRKEDKGGRKRWKQNERSRWREEEGNVGEGARQGGNLRKVAVKKRGGGS